VEAKQTITSKVTNEHRGEKSGHHQHNAALIKRKKVKVRYPFSIVGFTGIPVCVRDVLVAAPDKNLLCFAWVQTDPDVGRRSEQLRSDECWNEDHSRYKIGWKYV